MDDVGLEVRVAQRTKGPPRAAVVLCHGFGAPGDDLVSLWGELLQRQPGLADVRFYFPAAPLSLGGLGWGDSRAWWMIDLETMARLNQGDAASLRDFRRKEPEGLGEARARLAGLLEAIRKDTGLPPGKLVLGGFSQGAMLATDLALRLPEPPAGLAIFSGTLLLEDQWRALAPQRKGLQVLQSHGRQDPLLAFAAAEQLRDLLAAAGLGVQFLPFDGGHTLTVEVVDALAGFVERQVR